MAAGRVVRGMPGLGLVVLLMLAGSVAEAAAAAAALPTEALFSKTTHDPAVLTPKSLVGVAPAGRPLTPHQIEQCLKAWDSASARVRLVEYARSHEGRPLYYVVVTSAHNSARLETIQAGWRRLADPRGATSEELQQLSADLPPVAWLGYSIHGDETSGSNAAIALIYHLCAAAGSDVAGLLNDLVIVIDPQMNPDGRARALQQQREVRGALPNTDAQSLLHRGTYPSGRTNHYLFDLNRDWIFGVHPETKGRLLAIGAWNPLLLIDAHEMSALDTYLFSPAREPIHPSVPERLEKWNTRFARDQARAFDRFGWHYYTGEWNEEWYPGYSTSWAGCRGAVSILYEQASIDRDAIRRPEGRSMTYGESVWHHVVSSMANLRTFRRHRRELAREFVAERRTAVDATGPYANRAFAILPSANATRLRALVDLFALQGIEVQLAAEKFTVSKATDLLGRHWLGRGIPRGTLLVPSRQPLAHLVEALLDLDPRMSPKAVTAERRELLRYNRSTLYDVTAWNIPLLYGLEPLVLTGDLPDDLIAVTTSADRRCEVTDEAAAVAPWLRAATEETVRGGAGKAPRRAKLPVTWALDGEDDGSVAAAAHLLGAGLKVRVTDRPAQFGQHAFARGSLFVTRADNAGLEDAGASVVGRIAGRFGLAAVRLETGLGPDEQFDLGGRHFRLLAAPRIALVAGDGISAYDLGSIWHTLDRRIGMETSLLSARGLTETDLRSYNVLVLPAGGADSVTQAGLTSIMRWVRGGGTLVAIGGSARNLARPDANVGSVRTLPDSLGELDDYEQVVLQQWQARTASPDIADLYGHALDSALEYPWETTSAKRPDVAELKRRDVWQQRFMPTGVLVAGRVDDEHWLTFGAAPLLPVLFGKHPVLMARGHVEAPVRLGVFVPSGVARGGKHETAAADAGQTPTESPRGAAGASPRIGWATLPEGCAMCLRVSGLLWPEAAHRLANAAWVTRERVGHGQVILFASSPDFRGATLGMARVLQNALIYGPGLGADQPLR